MTVFKGCSLIWISLFVSSLCVVPVAQGSFQYTPEKEEKEIKVSSLEQGGKELAESGYALSQIGYGSPEDVESFGNDIAFETAVSMIVPEGWEPRIAKDEDALKDREVSWEGKGSWPHVLEKIGKENGVHFVVNWDHKQVFATSSESVAKSMQDAADFSGEGEEMKKGSPRDEMEPSKDAEREDKDKEEGSAEREGKDKEEKSAKREDKDKDKEEVVHKKSKEDKENSQSDNDSVSFEDKELKSLEFGPGKIEAALEEWADEWGYDLVFTGVEEKKNLALKHPISLRGKSFKEDLQRLSRDLNADSKYAFRFTAYERNDVLDVEVVRR